MRREAIMEALFALLSASTKFETTGRRLVMWSQVAAQPAMFLRNAGEETEGRPTGMPGKVTMECEVWLYSNAGKDRSIAPTPALNDLLDAVQTALKPPPGRPQTLGGLVTHCWIEGKTDIHPGDLDGQAIAVVPVKILIPSFGG